MEGSQTEFSILRRIFCNLLGYSYIEKRRNKPSYFTSTQDRFSQVAVVNTRESNIRDISENESYLDDVFDVLREQYQLSLIHIFAQAVIGTFFDDFTEEEMGACIAGAYDKKFTARDIVEMKEAGGAHFRCV